MSAAAIPDRIDLEKLLSPISGDKPTGENLRYEGTYDRLREARHEDDSTLTQGIYKKALKKADWREVERTCTDALQNRSKDIQIAAWLTESWIHLRGFSGCRDGLKLLTELMSRFWDDLHPQMTEGDPESRVGTLVWINEKLSMQLKVIPITSPQSSDMVAYSFADWEMACYLEQVADRGPNTPSDTDDQVSVARFQASAILTTTQSFLILFDDLDSTAEACLALEGLVEKEFGTQSTGLQRFKETLGDIQHLVADILHARPGEVAHSDPELESESSAATGHKSGSEIWNSPPIRSRAEAYWRLSEVAEYLLRTEPHSPTPYLIQRAVDWGSMSLTELFQQIIRNEGEMQEINRLLGLTNKEEGG